MLDFFSSIDTENPSFRTSETFITNLSEDCNSDKNIIDHLEIGESEQGRPIHAFVIGRGEKKVALLGGAHSDEPVGPEMLRLLVESIIIAKDKDRNDKNIKDGDINGRNINDGESKQDQEQVRLLLQEYTFVIISHINPDGEIKNHRWIKEWPDLASYAAHTFREKPGRDLEFGYPDMRRENRAVADFLRSYAPFHLYINFHGRGVAEGVMLLIERHWIDRSRRLQHDFIALAEEHDLPLHDHDRGGEKGFKYIGPGFTTTPEGRAMQQHFKEKGDEETASKFHLSSMEFIRSLGGDPLCLVTELPLYIISLKFPAIQEPIENSIGFRSTSCS